MIVIFLEVPGSSRGDPQTRILCGDTDQSRRRIGHEYPYWHAAGFLLQPSLQTRRGNSPSFGKRRNCGDCKKFGAAARRAKIAGFDAVEFHAGHSYLASQFLSPTTNNRTDEFGGCPENRARFPKMAMEEIRKAVGPQFPIIVRLSLDELAEGGNTIEDSLELMKYFCDEADIFSVSAGLNTSLQFQIDVGSLPDGWRSYMAKAVKERFGKPAITMGNIRSPKVAAEILERGDADLIGLGRGLIAEPDWVNKVRKGQICQLRNCISCNTGCAGNRIGFNQPIRCTVNPAVDQGEDYYKRKVTKPCNVVVIGGGVAGLEAACTAAEVGCTSVLLRTGRKIRRVVRVSFQGVR